MPSDPALISLNLWVLPVVNLNFEIPALSVQGVLSPAATVEQSKSILPLMRLLSDGGLGLESVPLPITISTMEK